MRQVMSDTPTHADVLAAIDKARVNKWSGPCLDCQACDDERPDDCTDRCLILGADDRNAHCDDLQAIAERHAPFADVIGMDQCYECSRERQLYEMWPCTEVQQIVISRLEKWSNNE